MDFEMTQEQLDEIMNACKGGTWQGAIMITVRRRGKQTRMDYLINNFASSSEVEQADKVGDSMITGEVIGSTPI